MDILNHILVIVQDHGQVDNIIQYVVVDQDMFQQNHVQQLQEKQLIVVQVDIKKKDQDQV